MSKIQIFADSTCDLTPELKEEFGIQTIPLNIVLDDKSYYDGEEITRDEIYAWANANKKTPKTAATGYEIAMERISPYIKDGYDVIFFGISEDMSTTCNVVRLVASDLETDRLFVIDSMSLSNGIALQVIRAAEMAREGKTAEEIVEAIEALRGEVSTSFIVDTLTYLARGGRCNAATALLGNTLKIHPKIEVNDGKMGVATKYRGNLKMTTLKYAKDMEEELLHCRHDIIFIVNSGHDPEIVKEVYDYIDSLHVFERIELTLAGGVICSHCGYGTLGIMYYNK